MISNQQQIETLQQAQTKPGKQAEIFHQKFVVHYDYPVCFTDGLFEYDNPVFANALRRSESQKKHRFVVFVDSNVAASWPHLIAQIIAYAEHWTTCLQLVDTPVVLPGGELIKNSPELVINLQRYLYEQIGRAHV